MQGDGRRREEVGWWEVKEYVEEWYEFKEDKRRNENLARVKSMGNV